jgi:hypothetical protein
MQKVPVIRIIFYDKNYGLVHGNCLRVSYHYSTNNQAYKCTYAINSIF